MMYEARQSEHTPGDWLVWEMDGNQRVRAPACFCGQKAAEFAMEHADRLNNGCKILRPQSVFVDCGSLTIHAPTTEGGKYRLGHGVQVLVDGKPFPVRSLDLRIRMDEVVTAKVEFVPQSLPADTPALNAMVLPQDRPTELFKCNTCGRKVTGKDNERARCQMMQPNGVRCCGMFLPHASWDQSDKEAADKAVKDYCARDMPTEGKPRGREFI